MISRPPNFPPESYLIVAKELARNQAPEFLRSAGDRAYYAAFLFCRDELTRKGYITPYYDYRDHNYVLGKPDDLLGHRNNDLYLIHVRRNQLTYQTVSLMNMPVPWMIENSEKTINRVKDLPENEGREYRAL